MIKKLSSVIMVFAVIFCLAACGSSSFEDKGDFLTGNKWESSDGGLLELKTDGTHKFYGSASNLADNYYKGEFTVLNAQDAINYLSENHGLNEEGQRRVMAQYGVEDQYYYVLILNNQERIIEGKNTLGQAVKVEYFGYYSPTDQTADLTSLKTMAQTQFRKK